MPPVIIIYLFVLDGNVIALFIRYISTSFIFSSVVQNECMKTFLALLKSVYGFYFVEETRL